MIIIVINMNSVIIIIIIIIIIISVIVSWSPGGTSQGRSKRGEPGSRGSETGIHLG